jgi:hypothetical protein
MSAKTRYLAVLVALAAGLWAPRLRGPLDLRYDAGVYYILGTSLAEGRGYRSLFTGQLTAAWPPAYPLVLAGLYRVAGPTPTIAVVANAVFG